METAKIFCLTTHTVLMATLKVSPCFRFVEATGETFISTGRSRRRSPRAAEERSRHLAGDSAKVMSIAGG